jgi:hypothetical protein
MGCHWGLVRNNISVICRYSLAGFPNGAKTQLLMHTNTNYLLDVCILLGLFHRGYRLMAWKVCIYLIKY